MVFRTLRLKLLPPVAAPPAATPALVAAWTREHFRTAVSTTAVLMQFMKIVSRTTWTTVRPVIVTPSCEERGRDDDGRRQLHRFEAAPSRGWDPEIYMGGLTDIGCASSAYDSCMNQFSTGQATRMAAMTSQCVRSSTLGRHFLTPGIAGTVDFKPERLSLEEKQVGRIKRNPDNEVMWI